MKQPSRSDKSCVLLHSMYYHSIVGITDAGNKSRFKVR